MSYFEASGGRVIVVDFAYATGDVAGSRIDMEEGVGGKTGILYSGVWGGFLVVDAVWWCAVGGK